MRTLRTVLFLLLITIPAHADQLIASYTADQWANAIYKAENSKNHPYGILARYRLTTPRKACINTISHQYRNWAFAGHPGSFLAYLASHYAPINSTTDTGTNQYWAKNVSFWLKKGA